MRQQRKRRWHRLQPARYEDEFEKMYGEEEGEEDEGQEEKEVPVTIDKDDGGGGGEGDNGGIAPESPCTQPACCSARSCP